MRAGEVISLLEKKHEEDVFVPECKTGPSQASSHLRLDAWVMKRSWSKPLVTGYEVKVSRSDFMRDDKWPGYMDYCNELYFVCPHGLIQPDELGEGVGLMWVTKTGTRLYTKKKAAHRDITIPDTLFRYILMSRAKITAPHFGGRPHEDNRIFWRNWLETRRLDQILGRQVSFAITQTIKERVIDAEAENRRLQEHIDRLERVKQFIESIGLDPDNPFESSPRRIEKQLEELRSIVPDGLPWRIEMLASNLKKIGEELEQLRAQEKKEVA